MGDAGDEVHLQFGQVLLLAGEADEHDGGEEHEAEDGGGDAEVAPAGAVDDGIERAFGVADFELPAAAVEVRRRAAFAEELVIAAALGAVAFFASLASWGAAAAAGFEAVVFEEADGGFGFEVGFVVGLEEEFGWVEAVDDAES